MVKYTGHQVQQLDPAVIKPASNKPMGNNKKGAHVSIFLCGGLTIRSDVSAGGGGGLGRVSKPTEIHKSFPRLSSFRVNIVENYHMPSGY